MHMHLGTFPPPPPVSENPPLSLARLSSGSPLFPLLGCARAGRATFNHSKFSLSHERCHRNIGVTAFFSLL